MPDQNGTNNKQEHKTSRTSRWRFEGLSLPSLRIRSGSQDRHKMEDNSDRKSRSLGGKISFWKRKSAQITDYDPTYRVIYLGNVLTGWAKGDGCVDKPLSTLWRNHISSEKPDILMKMTVVGSGLRAVTKEHGLTEYWANRITYCAAHPSYPRVFCWIYRHEGRKMKQELRCHAVLCPKEDKAKQIAKNLQDRLHQALVDFKKEKISRQNARLSLANSIHDNPSMPYRKLLLQTGTCNYKPPIERSKSAPKLTSIEEAEKEEDSELPDSDDEECVHNTNYNIAMLQVHRDPSIMLDECPTNRVLSFSSSSTMFCEDNHEEASDEEDEITDYIGSVGAASAASSGSPGSASRGSLTSPGDSGEPPDPDCQSLSDQSDSGHGDGLSSSLGLIRVSEQDTISDESGYSEDPIATSGKEVTVVKVNSSPEDQQHHKLEIKLNQCNSSNNSCNTQENKPRSSTSSWCLPINIDIDSSHYDSQESSPRDTQSSALTPSNLSPLSLSPPPDPPLSPNVILPTSPRDGITPSPRLTDLTVKSVFLSEFTQSEKMRYVERNPTKNAIVLNRQEFCINI